MIEHSYKVREKTWKLERYPKLGSTTLRAWSAADEFLADTVQLPSRNKPLRILVLNDAFGAISLPFSNHRTVVMVDSFLSEVAIRRNMKLNKVPEEAIQFISSTEEIQQKFDVLLIGMPSSMNLLEFQLTRVRAYLQSKCAIFAVAMYKDANNELYNILQQTLGPTSGPAIPSRKKARLFQIELDADTRRLMKDIPLRSYKIANIDSEILSAPGVFSSDRLDEGTRLLMEYIPENKRAISIVDYGCGSGVLGLVALSQCPKASLVMIDESRLALYSAQETFKKNNIDTKNVTFRLANGFIGTAPDSFDLVLSHPDLTVEGSYFSLLAQQFIAQSHVVLRPGGRLLFVTSKEYPVASIVEEVFGTVELLDEESNYRVYSAIKKE